MKKILILIILFGFINIFCAENNSEIKRKSEHSFKSYGYEFNIPKEDLPEPTPLDWLGYGAKIFGDGVAYVVRTPINYVFNRPKPIIKKKSYFEKLSELSNDMTKAVNNLGNGIINSMNGLSDQIKETREFMPPFAKAFTVMVLGGTISYAATKDILIPGIIKLTKAYSTSALNPNLKKLAWFQLIAGSGLNCAGIGLIKNSWAIFQEKNN